MAAKDPVAALLEEATCSICMEIYTDPVTIDCGHNFCLSCITRLIKSEDFGKTCPECREKFNQKNLNPNKRLTNIVQGIQDLTLHPEDSPGRTLCEEHGEKLLFFCETEGRLICSSCWKSPEHNTHREKLTEDTVQKYKLGYFPERTLCEEHGKKLSFFCETEDRAICMSCWVSPEHKTHGEKRLKEAAREYKNKLESEGQNIVAEIEGLRRLLQHHKQTLLWRLRKKDEITKLSDNISFLKALITEIKKKCEQPAELLKDVRSTLSRCEDVTPQTPEGLRKKYKVWVTLDPDTSHQYLALSEDGRRVTHTLTEQHRLDNPKRFTDSPSVLGKEGFSSGKHYWELQVLQDGGWTVGVARESVSRKEAVTHSPEGGVWAVSLQGTLYRQLGLYLDYEGGRLSVYNAETGEEIYTFTGAAFTGAIHPYLWLYRADLRLL